MRPRASLAAARRGATLTLAGAAPVAGVLTILLALACGRTPERPGAGPAKGDAPSRPPTAAAAHLARGEEARERAEYARARDELEKARALFEKDRDWEGCVRAWIGVGAVTARQGDYEAALGILNSALAAAREKLGPSHLAVARGQEEIGTVYAETGRPREGLELLAAALELRRAGKSGPLQTADTLRRIAGVRMDLGEDERALGLLGEAETLLRASVGDRHPHLGDVLIVKGAAYWGQGRYDQAVDALEEAVTILQADEAGQRGGLSAAYVNLGNAYWSKGDYDEARAHYEKALPLQVAIWGATHARVALTHYNMAVLHVAEGDYEAAIASAQRALDILVPALGEGHAQVVRAYNVLGEAFTGRGEPDRALSVLHKALALQASLPEAGDRTSGVTDTNLARAYEAKGDFARAARHHHRALAFDLSTYGRRHPDVAEDLVLLGDLCLKTGDEDEALRFFGRAIAANDPQHAGNDLEPPLDTAFSEGMLLKTLQGAARARTRRGLRRSDRQELERAALVYEHASRLIDRMRVGYRAEGSKLLLAARASETYDEAIRVELELRRLAGDARHLERAFGYAEKSKAGILRDALNEARARSFAGIPAPLLDEERRLRADLASLDLRLAEGQLQSGFDEGRLQALRDERFARNREYEALRRRFETEYPDYYDLKYRFETASPAEVGERLLDERTVLVEYFLGQERLVVFTLVGRDLQVTSVAREPSLEGDIQELRRAILEGDEPSFAPAARRLYRTLLAPVEGRLAGRDLLIVPDGALSAVPFEALLTQDAGPQPGTSVPPYVVRDHAVSYAYSATVLLQGLRLGRPSAAEEFVGFAPVFAEGGPSAEAPRPLPAARQEVEDVRRLFAQKAGLFGGWLSGRSRVYLGRDASEARLKSAGLDRYRYVHLATHGVVDEEHPGLSRLLLTPEGGTREDGVLHLGEIYSLRLNADLVVLSACDTGRGRIARGEGIIGLTRGFLYAGAQRVLVSLWPVSDAAASGLVVDFYRELLAGVPKAHALRASKLRAMARNPEHAKPKYWSSLVLVGDRR